MRKLRLKAVNNQSVECSGPGTVVGRQTHSLLDKGCCIFREPQSREEGAASSRGWLQADGQVKPWPGDSLNFVERDTFFALGEPMLLAKAQPLHFESCQSLREPGGGGKPQPHTCLSHTGPHAEAGEETPGTETARGEPLLKPLTNSSTNALSCLPPVELKDGPQAEVGQAV